MTHLTEADRIYGIALSKIREMENLSDEKMREGKPVIHLEIGEPDFPTPRHISEAARKALEEGETHYAPTSGTPSLRQSVSDNYCRRFGIRYDPDSEVLITQGVTQGLYLVSMTFLNSGDEVLIPDPGYLCYSADTRVAQAKPLPFKLNETDGYQIVPGALDALITPKTKAIFINSPSNPCGSVLNRNSLEEIARIAVKYDLFVLSDEVYAGIVYDGAECASIASLPGMRERTIVLGGLSKYYAMTGWRVGYILCDRKFQEPLMRMNYYNLACLSPFGQAAAVTALTADDTPSREMVQEYRRRRDYVYTAVNAIEGLSCQKPAGAFYMMAGVRRTGLRSDDFCRYILDDCCVALTPGNAFGEAGEGFARISYATSMANLREAMERIGEAVKKLQKHSVITTVPPLQKRASDQLHASRPEE
jgi:aminotransferase